MNCKQINHADESVTCGGWSEYHQPPRGPIQPYIRGLLRAMQAHDIPADTCGIWEVYKRSVPAVLMLEKGSHQLTCTHLYRRTYDTIYENFGELVMVDHFLELQTHLEFVLKARGKVLVTGLGLGCVIRGLLTHRQVSSITVVERDPSVVKLIAPYLHSSIKIIQADVLDWVKYNDESFDYAWHDLWRDPDTEEYHLQVIHTQAMYALRNKVKHQGAWKYPREFRRLFEENGYGIKRVKHG